MATPKTDILLYGGTFDPIHMGHLIVARSVAEVLSAERVLLIPSAVPPHKQEKDYTDSAVRLEMTRAAVQGDRQFEVSDCELNRPGPSYTLETVRHFRKIYGQGKGLTWLIGMDSVNEFFRWYQVDKLMAECAVVIAVRSGWSFQKPKDQTALSERQIQQLEESCLETPSVEISSTEVRRRVREGLSIRYLVPESVERFIREKKLYQQ